MSLGKNKEYESEEDKLENMSVEANVYDDSDEESTQPVREEKRSSKNPNSEIYSEERISLVGDTEEQGEGEDDYYDGNMYHLIKAHPAELSSLIAKVESLQSQIKQLKVNDNNGSVNTKKKKHK
jgi:hypothetical protein